MVALDLGDAPLPEGEGLGVGVVDAEDGNALFDPIQKDGFELLPHAFPVFTFKVEGVDVLVLFGWVFGVLDGAVGAGFEPDLVIVDVGVVGGGLEGDVHGDEEAQAFGLFDEAAEVLKSAEGGEDRFVAALQRPDGPGAAFISGLMLGIVVWPLAELAANGVDGGHVDDVEAHLLDVGEARFAIEEGAMLALLGRGGAGEELVPGTEAGVRGVDREEGFSVGFGGEALVRIAEGQLVEPGVCGEDAEVGWGLGATEFGGALGQPGGVFLRDFGGPGGGGFDEVRADQVVDGGVGLGLDALEQVATPGLEVIDPALDLEAVAADFFGAEAGGPAVVFHGAHGDFGPVIRPLAMHEQGCGNQVVAVGEDVGFHADLVAHGALGGEAPAVHFGGDGFDDYATASVGAGEGHGGSLFCSFLPFSDQPFVEGDGLVGDGCPTEGVFDALAPGIAELAAFGWVLQKRVEGSCQVAGELLRVAGEAGDGILVEGHEVAGDAFDDDFLDAASGACDYGRAAGHGFQIDDSKGLIDRGAAEDLAVGVELDGLFLGDHLLDPDNAGVVRAGALDFIAKLGGDLRRVGRAGAEDNLGVRGEVADGVDEVGDTFLAGDAADEEDVGDGRVDAVIEKGLGIGGLLVFGEVDAVVDDVDAGGIDFGVSAEDVRLRALGDGDDGVRVEDCGLLHPGAHRVAAAELLGLPGAQRFERVGGEDERDAVELFGQETGHGDVPGVRVNDVDALESLDLGEVEAEGLKRALELALGVVGDLGPRFFAADVEGPRVGVLLAPAMDFDFDFTSEFAAEVIDVDSGAAVDLGWVFACE